VRKDYLFAQYFGGQCREKQRLSARCQKYNVNAAGYPAQLIAHFHLYHEKLEESYQHGGLREFAGFHADIDNANFLIFNGVLGKGAGDDEYLLRNRLKQT
jgi:hypothetical protein